MVKKPEWRFRPLSDLAAKGETPVTPAGLKSFYNVDETGGSSNQSQCIFESLGQYTSESDLAAFLKKFSLPEKKIAEDIGNHVSDSECETNPDNCGEANLDAQYMVAMAPETPLTNWYIEEKSDDILSSSLKRLPCQTTLLLSTLYLMEVSKNLSHHL